MKKYKPLSGFLNCETGDFSILMRDIYFSHPTSNSFWCLWFFFLAIVICYLLAVFWWVEVSLEETLQEHCHHLSMHAFISGCFSLHAHASLLVIFPPYKPTNCNSTAIVPTGFLKFSLISAQAMFVNFGLAKETGGGCYLRWVNGVVWFWSIILLCFLWLSSTSMTANCHSLHFITWLWWPGTDLMIPIQRPRSRNTLTTFRT